MLRYKSISLRRQKMLRCENLIKLLCACCLCTLISFASSEDSLSLYTASSTIQTEPSSSDSSGEGKNISVSNRLPPQAQPTIRDALAEQRVRIANEIKNFLFASCEACAAATTPADLIPEDGGRPVRSILVSTWRSGSSFLGDILNAMPGNYYHYEPLSDFGIKQIRTAEDEQVARRNLRKLLNCDYEDMEHYLNFSKTHSYPLDENERLWSVCKKMPQLCWNADFLTAFCKLFPLQSMKTVRLRLSTAELLLEDESLNVRIMLLVRDPRGTMLSRKHLQWCTTESDCGATNLLCDDLVGDFKSAEVLLKKYPTRFRTLRYEELSVNPYEMTQQILNFYGLPFDPAVKEFLDTHTKVNIGNFLSTYRDSKSAPFHWIQDLSIEEIRYIQESCAKALELWGYREIENFTDYQNTFDPIIQPAPLTT